MADRAKASAAQSWRRALAPGEVHGFYANPGWWDARDVARNDEDVPRLRAALVRAWPPLPGGSGVLDVGAGTGALVLIAARFYPDVRFTLVDAEAGLLARAAEKLAAAHPALTVTIHAEVVDPLDPAPLPGGPYRLVTSSIALHDIARPAEPEDETGRARHRGEHVALLRRIYASLEPGGHLVYGDAMRARFRVVEHLDALREAGFAEVDCAYVQGRMLVCGGQRPAATPTGASAMTRA